MDKKIIGLVALGLVGLAAIIIVFSSFFIIQPGVVGFTKTLGKINDGLLENGIHFKKPIIDTAIKFNIQTQKIDVTTESSTRDLQVVQSNVAINYNYDKLKVKNLYETIGREDIIADKIIIPAINEKIKSAMSQYTSEELITKRSEVSDKVRTLLNESLKERGINVEFVNFINLDFSEAYNLAIEQKVTAEQEALAEKNRLEKAKAEAEQKIVRAEAEAKTIEIQAQAIQNQGGDEYIKLKWIEKWNGKLPTTIAGQDTSMIMMINEQNVSEQN